MRYNIVHFWLAVEYIRSGRLSSCQINEPIQSPSSTTSQVHKVSMFCSLALSLLSFLLAHPHLSATTPLPDPQTHDLRLISAESVTTLYQFEFGSWLENIAIRPNGHILLTRLDVPQLWEVNPFSPSTSHDPRLVYTVDDPTVTGLAGIAEIAPDVFAVIAGNITDAAGTHGSFSIWKVAIDTQGNAVGAKVAAISEARFLNGMALLSSRDGGTILVGDHAQGLVYRVNMENGDHSVAIQDPAMRANPPPGFPVIGINGMKIQKGHLFFTNLFQGTLCKIPIDTRTGGSTGPVKVITTNVFGADDFALDSSGTPYVASFISKQLVAVKPTGELAIIADDLKSPTSAAFGRTAHDGKTIYVTTSGAIFNVTRAVPVEGGRVVAVKLKC